MKLYNSFQCHNVVKFISLTIIATYENLCNLTFIIPLLSLECCQYFIIFYPIIVILLLNNVTCSVPLLFYYRNCTLVQDKILVITVYLQK